MKIRRAGARSDDQPTYVRLPLELKRQLQAIAVRENRTLSAQIRHILESYLAGKRP